MGQYTSGRLQLIMTRNVDYWAPISSMECDESVIIVSRISGLVIVYSVVDYRILFTLEGRKAHCALVHAALGRKVIVTIHQGDRRTRIFNKSNGVLEYEGDTRCDAEFQNQLAVTNEDFVVFVEDHGRQLVILAKAECGVWEERWRLGMEDGFRIEDLYCEEGLVAIRRNDTFQVWDVKEGRQLPGTQTVDIRTNKYVLVFPHVFCLNWNQGLTVMNMETGDCIQTFRDRWEDIAVFGRRLFVTDGSCYCLIKMETLLGGAETDYWEDQYTETVRSAGIKGLAGTHYLVTANSSKMFLAYSKSPVMKVLDFCDSN